MLENKTLEAAPVDLALTRLLTLRMRTGLFDPPQDQPFFQIGPSTA